MSLSEALEHPEGHIRAQARVILECSETEVDIRKETEQLVREIESYEEFLERQKS